MPSNRWARFEYYKELFSMGVIDQTELLKQTDVADMEGVLERAGIHSQLNSQVQQLQEEVKKLKGDLQTAQRESLHDRKRVELKDFEVKLAKMEAQMQAASQLYKNRTNDHLKQIKEEVNIMVKEADNPQNVMNEELLGLDEE
jgi:YesN/AraC family two-component response regulator